MVCNCDLFFVIYAKDIISVSITELQKKLTRKKRHPNSSAVEFCENLLAVLETLHKIIWRAKCSKGAKLIL
jgi:hypothetical protein